MAEEKEGEGGEKKKLDLGKFLNIALVAVNVGVMGGGAFLVHQSTIGYHPPSLREPAAFEQLQKERQESGEFEPVVYSMEPFTVNLAGAPRRVIRVEMNLEMLDKEGYEEVVTLGPEARDSIVRILNAKEFKDVETIQGKLFLKDQVAVTLNKFLKSGVVKDIYFSDFVVQ